MENISFDKINPSSLKNLFRKLCMVSNWYAKKNNINSNLSHSEKVKKHYNLDTATGKKLKARIQQLEEDLLKTSEERDAALEENRDRIKELEVALLSIKTKIEKMILAKKEKEKRIKYLERDISRGVK